MSVLDSFKLFNFESKCFSIIFSFNKEKSSQLALLSFFTSFKATFFTGEAINISEADTFEAKILSNKIISNCAFINIHPKDIIITNIIAKSFISFNQPFLFSIQFFLLSIKTFSTSSVFKVILFLFLFKALYLTF